MTLDTNLNHVESAVDYQEILTNNEKVAICCGRMGPMCIPVYAAFEKLEEQYTSVKFLDMNFDTSVAMETIRSLPEVRNFGGLPFTVYYRNGKVVAATTSIQSKGQVKEILDSKLA